MSMRTGRPMRALAAVVVAAVFASTAAGCASVTGVRSVDPQTVQTELPPSADVAQGYYIPANTAAVVTLDGALGTDVSRAGDPFTGRVVEELRSPTGVVVVPAGALVRGRVARVVGGSAPLLELVFDNVTTTDGRDALLDVRIEQAEQVRFLESPHQRMNPDDPSNGGGVNPEQRSVDFDGRNSRPVSAAASEPRAAGAPRSLGAAVPGSGTSMSAPFDPGPASVQKPNAAIRLPEGAHLSVRLTRPLVP